MTRLIEGSSEIAGLSENEENLRRRVFVPYVAVRVDEKQ